MAADMLIKVHIANAIHEVRVAASGTVSTLRAAIAASLDEAASQQRSLRIIFAGRMLRDRDDDTRLAELNMVDGSNVHVVVGPPVAGAAVPPLRQRGAPSDGRTRAAEDVDDDAAPAATRVGFDRLRLVGLDDADVSVLRSTYLPTVVDSMSSSMPALPGESEQQRILRMEDAWIRAQPVDSEFALNLRPLLMQRFREMHGGMAQDAAGLHASQADADAFGSRSEAPEEGQGNVSSLVCGIIVGLVGGVLMLIFLLHPRMSRRFKSGIVAGVMISIAVSYLLPRAEPTPASAVVPADAPWPGEGIPMQRIVTLRRMLRGSGAEGSAE